MESDLQPLTIEWPLATRKISAKWNIKNFESGVFIPGDTIETPYFYFNRYEWSIKMVMNESLGWQISVNERFMYSYVSTFRPAVITILNAEDKIIISNLEKNITHTINAPNGSLTIFIEFLHESPLVNVADKHPYAFEITTIVEGTQESFEVEFNDTFNNIKQYTSFDGYHITWIISKPNVAQGDDNIHVLVDANKLLHEFKFVMETHSSVGVYTMKDFNITNDTGFSITSNLIRFKIMYMLEHKLRDI